ncbi:MAG: hypothetical protein GY807_04165 [Gammaproteobacteria bacterium]|nr:hypothetical protein [Gammaproteobacteria bacterium]
MFSPEKGNDRLIALVLVGVLALNYPLLSLFSGASFLFGIPILYLYLFFIWGIFISLAALIIEHNTKKGKISEQLNERTRN